MRKVIVVIFAFVSLFSGIAHADIINVLSESYNINVAIQHYYVYQGVLNDSFMNCQVLLWVRAFLRMGMVWLQQPLLLMEE